MKTIDVLDKTFVPFLSAAKIEERIQALAATLNYDYKDKNPLFVAILNGSFMFATDMYKHINVDSQITFIKLASYKGTTSTGNVITAIGLEENLKDRHIIVVEDIVDTGKTLHTFLPQLFDRGAASVEILTLLTKPEALQYEMNIKYIGFEIENKFVVGYGLDYDGYGRNIPEIYQLKN